MVHKSSKTFSEHKYSLTSIKYFPKASLSKCGYIQNLWYEINLLFSFKINKSHFHRKIFSHGHIYEVRETRWHKNHNQLTEGAKWFSNPGLIDFNVWSHNYQAPCSLLANKVQLSYYRPDKCSIGSFKVSAKKKKHTFQLIFFYGVCLHEILDI